MNRKPQGGVYAMHKGGRVWVESVNTATGRATIRTGRTHRAVPLADVYFGDPSSTRLLNPSGDPKVDAERLRFGDSARRLRDAADGLLGAHRELSTVGRTEGEEAREVYRLWVAVCEKAEAFEARARGGK